MEKNAFSLVRVSIVLVVDAMLVVTLILLSVLDTMVNGMLYDFGLVFSHAWAEPYWLIMRTSMVLIAVPIITLSIFEFVYPLLRKKPQPVETETTNRQKKPKAK